MDVPVEQPHSLIDRPELAVALGLPAVALVREVADEDLPVADGQGERSLASLDEPCVDVLLLQAKGPLPVSVPAAVVVPRVQDLVPGQAADALERRVSFTTTGAGVMPMTTTVNRKASGLRAGPRRPCRLPDVPGGRPDEAPRGAGGRLPSPSGLDGQ